MVTFFKTYNITPIVEKSKRNKLKLNMLLCYCIGYAAKKVKEFYMLPIGEKLFRFDKIAVNTIVQNKNGEISSCDIPATENLEDYMVIGTSAITNVEIDGAVGMYSGIFNNQFIICGKYSTENDKYMLKISFQFHHTQMDGLHAGEFLRNLE